MMGTLIRLVIYLIPFYSIAILFQNKMHFYSVAKEQDDIEDEIEVFGTSTGQVQEYTFQVPNEKWTATALREIAFYLRNYKYNEWDRRYFEEKPQQDTIGFFTSFPMPPLRSLDWKVNQNCKSDFYRCIIYLHSLISAAPFTRNDDTVVILNQNSIIKKYVNTNKLNFECQKALVNSEKSGLPFDSPLQKFQWSTSASYYMCWYTMLGTPVLTMLGESCDNFANCWDPTFGEHNNDVRSDDRLSFSCAMYSFCPDPCCPVKHLSSLFQCYNDKANPCFIENEKREITERLCKMNRKDNQSLKDIIANRWNISCHCVEKGFVWKSKFGMCVDINECVTGDHSCEHKTEDCLNLPGTFKCTCKWGFTLDKHSKKCFEDKTILQRNIELDHPKIDPLTEKLKSSLPFCGIRF